MTETVNCLTKFVLHPNGIYAFSLEGHLNLIQRNQKLTFQQHTFDVKSRII